MKEFLGSAKIFTASYYGLLHSLRITGIALLIISSRIIVTIIHEQI